MYKLPEPHVYDPVTNTVDGVRATKWLIKQNAFRDAEMDLDDIKARYHLSRKISFTKDRRFREVAESDLIKLSGKSVAPHKSLSASCMRHRYPKEVPHPYDAYDSGDFEIAALWTPENILLARVVICTKNNVAGPIYADHYAFARKLIDYCPGVEFYHAHRSWVGAQLVPIQSAWEYDVDSLEDPSDYDEWRECFGPDPIPRMYVLPYLDLDEWVDPDFYIVASEEDARFQACYPHTPTPEYEYDPDD